MNEEPIAIYERTLTKKEYIAGAAWLFRRMPYTVVVCLVAFLVWLYLLLGVLVFASSGDYPDGLWEMFLEITLLLLFVYALPYAGGLFRYRQMKMLESRDSRVQWVFFQNRMEKRQGGVPVQVLRYEDIRKVRYHKHLHFLSASHLVCVMLQEDGFIQGDFDTVCRCMEAQSGRKLRKK